MSAFSIAYNTSFIESLEIHQSPPRAKRSSPFPSTISMIIPERDILLKDWEEVQDQAKERLVEEVIKVNWPSLEEGLMFVLKEDRLLSRRDYQNMVKSEKHGPSSFWTMSTLRP